MSRSNLRPLALAAVLAGMLGGSSPAVAAPARPSGGELSPQTWLERLAGWLSLQWRDWFSLETIFARDDSDPSNPSIPRGDDGHVVDPNG